MIIRLKVFEQTLSIVGTKSIPRKGSKDYLVLQFTFSSDWKDLDKLCYLQSGEVSQPIEVVDNLVEVPEWFTQQDRFYVTLFGKSGSQEVPTNVVPLRLEKSNTLWEQDAPEPQPSWLVKVIDLNNHPPVPGENGYWMLWDTDSGAYIESDLPQSSVRPDWNQNDDTKPDYVKNRPFYTGDPTENVLFNGSFVFTIIGMGPIGERGVYNGVTDFSPEIGQTYQVSWDGAVYSCVGTEYNSLIALGNLSIMNFGSDTGEPFLMTCGTGSINIYTHPVGSSHTISIGKMVSPVVQIDPKYIRDMYYTEILGKSIEGIEIANLPINGTLDENIPLEIGQIWNVGYKDGSGYINTSDYTNLEVQRAEDGTLYIGDYPDAHNYPFYITATSVKSNPLWISNMGISSIILFGVSGTIPEEVVHKIDKKYLVQPDWNQNDSTASDYVKNRPFYTGDPVETEVLVEESTVTFEDFDGMYCAKVPSTFEATVGETYNVSWDGAAYECICVDFDGQPVIGNLSIPGAGADTGEPFVMNVANGEGIQIVTADTSASHTISISAMTQEIVKLDPKYIDSMYYTEIGVTSIEGLEIKDIPYDGTLDQNLPLEIGQVWNVGYKDRNGSINLDWTLEVHQAEDGTLYLGTYPDVNNVPFYITTTSTKSNSGWINNSDVVSLIIVGVSGTMFGEVVHKIPSKYIPTLHYMDKENPTCTGAFSLNRKNNTDIGKFSFAEGYNTTASGNYSHAEGQNTTASGFYSHSECNSTTASGNGSHAEGRNTIALGQNSHAEGYSLNQAPTTINTYTSDSEIINVWKNKKFTLAKGLSSHAEGTNTLALNDSSHSEGYDTTASGVYSHSEGYATTASGFHSHSEGSLTTASGYHSHSEGYDTTASGVCSHSEGSYTYARSECQHVQGKYNIEDSSATYAHIVGNGTADNARSNAHTLDWNGNAWYAGTVEGKALILPSSTENSTKKFKITVDDSGALTATEVT